MWKSSTQLFKHYKGIMDIFEFILIFEVGMMLNVVDNGGNL